jgi:hypothetical protein
MWSKDFFLLMKGVGKVAEQIAKTQLPPLATKSAQITRHVNELSKLGPFLTKTLFHDVKKMGTSGVSDVEATATNIASTLTQNVNPNMSAAEKLQQIDQQIEELAKENISTQYSPKKQHKATVGGSHTHHHLNYEDIRYDPSNHKIQKSHHEEAVKEPLILKEKKTKTTTIQPPKDEQATTVHPTVDTVRHQVEENLPPSYTTNVPHTTPESEQIPNALQTRTWKERHVPSSPISRILGFGSLAAKLAVGTATEIVRTGGKTGARSAFISDSNAEKLAETLCTMRGAALKLGQMLSIQDENLIPSKLADALDRVRQK